MNLAAVQVVSVLLLAAAALAAPDASAGGHAVQDDLAHTLTVPAAPLRIVSLAPGTTEMLFAAGAGPLFDLGPYYLSTLGVLFGPASRVAAKASATAGWPSRIRSAAWRATAMASARRRADESLRFPSRRKWSTE